MFSRRDMLKGVAAAGTLSAAGAAAGRPEPQDGDVVEIPEIRVTTDRFEAEYGRRPRRGLVRTWHFELLDDDGEQAWNGGTLSLHGPYVIVLALAKSNAWTYGATVVDVGP